MAELYDATDALVGLARTLRAAGVNAAPDRVQAAVAALAVLDPTRRQDVYWSGRLSLCGTVEEARRYDAVFDAYFGERPGTVVRRQRILVPKLQLTSTDDALFGSDEQEDVTASASAAAGSEELLRHRDVSRLTAQERAELHRLLARLRLPGEQRRTRRHRPAARGRVDRGRTLRAWMRAGGEPAELRRSASRTRARRVVLLVDVSGSMERYAGALLRFSHAAARRSADRTEVFALGTRLTRLTREMALRDPDAAMAAVAEAVPDAGGGTRLGLLLKEFLDRWGQRGTARGAVVVVLSDGWERGDPALLGEQVARLHRLAHRVVWANPRKAAPGYAPLAGGMAAALPHVDDFVEGHSLAALEHLADVVRGARHA
ncbi:MAG: VWA domain-containing protein [Actinobacteria bacterium]|nr:VWA domain-containing protein [Actinomycetota bacterium]MCA1721990.1 VWA domain-containing protein [Actinomycetota bacterium]